MIVKLDIRILVVLCGLAALTQGGLSLLFASQEARTRALRSVGFAAISMAVALFGMALQGVIPDLFAIVIAQGLIGIAILLVDRGAREFQQEPTRDLLGTTVVAITTLGVGVLVSLTDDLRPRIILVSLGGLLLHARLAWRLSRGARNGGTPAHRVTEYIFWSFAGVMLVRLVAAAVSLSHPASDTPDLIQAMTLPVGTLLLSAATLGFWSMEVQRLHRELTKLATTDELTGALNRRALVAQFERYLARHSRCGEPVSLVLFDLDHFKRINDTYGHPAGDEVLRQAVQVLEMAVRPGDTIGRFGGEEFAVLIPAAGPSTAREIAERARAALAAAPLCVGDRLIWITSSVGLASFPVHGETVAELIRSADAALYAAKAAGRNCVRLPETAVSVALDC